MGRPKGSKNNSSVQKNTPSSLSPSIQTPNGLYTVEQVKQSVNKYDELKEIFAATNDALQLIDLTKNESRTFTQYDKEKIRSYLKNPFSNQKQLRNLSRFLYRMCYDYKRIVTHFANMICGDTFNIISLIDFTKNVNQKKVIKNYYNTAIKWQRMDFANELLKLLITAWREDSVYAIIYDDSDQVGGTCFFHILDGDYCKISTIEEGIPRFAFDFTYFTSHKTSLEYYDSFFSDMYEAYQKDPSLRWQEIPYERQFCLKVNIDDPTMDYPPFCGLFQRMISLLDLENIQNAKDELSAYKLLVARLKPLSGSKDPDDFEVDIRTAIKYYNKFKESLPDCVNACISPLPIEAVEFKNLNTTEDEDMLGQALNNVFKTIGGVILDNTKTGTTIYEAQIIADMKIAQSTLLPQINRWINLYMKYKLGDDHAIIKYIDGVSPYTRKVKRKELLESAQNGFSTKLEICILDGKSPIETISQLYFENECLGLVNKLIPLSTSYTKSSNDGTKPELDSDELTDSGSITRES